jgi:hypothetical protein
MGDRVLEAHRRASIALRTFRHHIEKYSEPTLDLGLVPHRVMLTKQVEQQVEQQ